MSGILAWVIFLALSIVVLVMAASMILTMSMYRAGLALMASFVALAGLFILLDADLLAAIQIMMNVGGMLIMVLFMVMIMMDPGGEMMWDMKRKMHLPELGAFSMHMPRGKAHEEPVVQDMTQMPHEENMNMDISDHDMAEMQNMSPRQNYEMMVSMAMSTAQLPWAIVLGAALALLLIALVVMTPWPVSSAIPTQDAAREVGVLLLSRYMIGFEGAAFLIVAGIAGAVLLGKREHSPIQKQEEATKTGTAGKEADGEKLFTCPMHPDIREPHPGTCPICSMQLIPVQEETKAIHEPMQGDYS